MSVPDMKLGNVSAAMGVGAYFFILRLRVSGLEWASWSLLVRAGKLTRWGDVDNQQLVSRGVAKNASCNLVCLLRVADLLSLTSCVRTYE